MDQVFITDLEARGILGINNSEREKPQEIRINIILFTDQSKAGKSDDIQDCVNYSTLAKKVITHAETARGFTVEALAADMVRLCLEEAGETLKEAGAKFMSEGSIRLRPEIVLLKSWQSY